MFGLIRNFFGPSADFKKLLEGGAIIVDVRTPSEYKTGHISGSINIPVDLIKGKVEELRKKNQTVITCCRSGARSGMAKGILLNAGINAYNGGPWNVLDSKIK
jgi:phage shock protein E